MHSHTLQPADQCISFTLSSSSYMSQLSCHTVPSHTHRLTPHDMYVSMQDDMDMANAAEASSLPDGWPQLNEVSYLKRGAEGFTDHTASGNGGQDEWTLLRGVTGSQSVPDGDQNPTSTSPQYVPVNTYAWSWSNSTTGLCVNPSQGFKPGTEESWTSDQEGMRHTRVTSEQKRDSNNVALTEEPERGPGKHKRSLRAQIIRHSTRSGRSYA